MNLQILSRYFVRPAKQKSDIFFLVLAAMVGAGAGLLMTEKISIAVGIPFFFFTTLILHFTWRSPVSNRTDAS